MIKLYHSIAFGNKNTWDDWHLIPKSRPVFNPPSVKTTYVEIPGGDGILDLTEALTGRVLYKNRVGSIEFYVENGFRDWTILYSEIMAHLHGQKMTAVLEDDPGFYYEGRFTVNAWRSDPQRSTIVIDYDVDPYKRDSIGTDEEWLWDTFNFETDIIRYYKDLPVNGTLYVTVIGSAMLAVPTIEVSATGMNVTFEGITYDLKKGINQISDIVITEGENLLIFGGYGTVTIGNRGGML